MVDSIVLDQKRVLPCAAHLAGRVRPQRHLHGRALPAGRRGLEEIVKIELSDDEQVQLEPSADAVRELVGVMGL